MIEKPASSFLKFRDYGIKVAALFAWITFSACSSGTGTSLFDSDCAANNPNSQDAELIASTSGASTDMSQRAVKNGDALGTVAMKDIRRGETTTLTFEFTNQHLAPLRSFALTPSATGTYTISSGAAGDCSTFRHSVL